MGYKIITNLNCLVRKLLKCDNYYFIIFGFLFVQDDKR